MRSMDTIQTFSCFVSFIRKLLGLGGLPLPDSKDNIMEEKCQILRSSHFITFEAHTVTRCLTNICRGYPSSFINLCIERIRSWEISSSISV